MGELFVKRACGIGPVTCCGRRAGGTVLLAFLAGARVSCRRAVRGQAGAPAAAAPVRARARTNELEAAASGGRRSGARKADLRLRVASGAWVCRVGLTSTHSAPAWSAGAMTVPSGAGLLSQFFERGVAGQPTCQPGPDALPGPVRDCHPRARPCARVRPRPRTFCPPGPAGRIRRRWGEAAQVGSGAGLPEETVR